MAYTGGPLNHVNETVGISIPKNSIAVMKLIKLHNPNSKEELEILIKQHYIRSVGYKKCTCGIVGKGTVEMFGQKLFNSQIQVWGKSYFTLAHCKQWMYNLFITNSLNGGKIEKKSINLLQNLIKCCSFEETEGYVDERLRIDIIVKYKDIEICGIQVKPLSFKLMPKDVIARNFTANKRWNKPVFYLNYRNDEEFDNIDEIKQNIKNIYENLENEHEYYFESEYESTSLLKYGDYPD